MWLDIQKKNPYNITYSVLYICLDKNTESERFVPINTGSGDKEDRSLCFKRNDSPIIYKNPDMDNKDEDRDNRLAEEMVSSMYLNICTCSLTGN